MAQGVGSLANQGGSAPAPSFLRRAYGRFNEMTDCAKAVAPTALTALFACGTVAAILACALTGSWTIGACRGITLALAFPMSLSAVALAIQTKNPWMEIASWVAVFAFVVLGTLSLQGICPPAVLSPMIGVEAAAILVGAPLLIGMGVLAGCVRIVRAVKH